MTETHERAGHPGPTSALPNSVEEVSQEELDQVNSGDWATYRQEKEDLLNSLAALDWDPNLTTLDEVVGSLHLVITADRHK